MTVADAELQRKIQEAGYAPHKLAASDPSLYQRFRQGIRGDSLPATLARGAGYVVDDTANLIGRDMWNFISGAQEGDSYYADFDGIIPGLSELRDQRERARTTYGTQHSPNLDELAGYGLGMAVPGGKGKIPKGSTLRTGRVAKAVDAQDLAVNKAKKLKEGKELNRSKFDAEKDLDKLEMVRRMEKTNPYKNEPTMTPEQQQAFKEQFADFRAEKTAQRGARQLQDSTAQAQRMGVPPRGQAPAIRPEEINGAPIPHGGSTLANLERGLARQAMDLEPMPLTTGAPAYRVRTGDVIDIDAVPTTSGVPAGINRADLIDPAAFRAFQQQQMRNRKMGQSPYDGKQNVQPDGIGQPNMGMQQAGGTGYTPKEKNMWQRTPAWLKGAVGTSVLGAGAGVLYDQFSDSFRDELPQPPPGGGQGGDGNGVVTPENSNIPSNGNITIDEDFDALLTKIVGERQQVQQLAEQTNDPSLWALAEKMHNDEMALKNRWMDLQEQRLAPQKKGIGDFLSGLGETMYNMSIEGVSSAPRRRERELMDEQLRRSRETPTGYDKMMMDGGDGLDRLSKLMEVQLSQEKLKQQQFETQRATDGYVDPMQQLKMLKMQTEIKELMSKFNLNEEQATQMAYQNYILAENPHVKKAIQAQQPSATLPASSSALTPPAPTVIN